MVNTLQKYVPGYKMKVEPQKSVVSLLSDKKKCLVELREKLSLINNPNLIQH